MKILKWEIERSSLYDFHSWMGLIVGTVMILVGFSGAIAVFNNEIEWLVTPEFRADPAKDQASIDVMVESVRTAYPGVAFELVFPPGDHWSYSAFVSAEEGPLNLLISAETGRIVKRIPRDGYTWSVSNWIRQFHVRLLMGRWGRVFVGIFGVTIFLSGISGILVYRNWFKSVFQIRRTKRRRVFYMDVHKVVGLWSLGFILLIGLTGAILGLENLYNSIEQRWIEPLQADLPTSDEIVLSALGEDGRYRETLPASQLLDAAEVYFPAMTATRIAFPATHFLSVESKRPVVIEGDHPGPLIASGGSRIQIDPHSGDVLQAFDAREARALSKLYNTLDPLHYGNFGREFGSVMEYGIKALWVILGFAPGVLAITGSVMWWLRRKRRKKPGGSEIDFPEGSLSQRIRRSWKPVSLGLIPFLIVGYGLQATIWRGGWAMSRVLFEHWMVKPLSLMIVCFPVTLYLCALSDRHIDARATRENSVWLASGGSIPLGVWYILTLCLFN